MIVIYIYIISVSLKVCIGRKYLFLSIQTFREENLQILDISPINQIIYLSSYIFASFFPFEASPERVSLILDYLDA